MGIVHKKPENGPEVPGKDFDNGWVWLVFRLDPHTGPDWHIQGIATSEEVAVSMCEDSNYWIGPLPLDMLLPYSRQEWPGLYCPLAVDPHHQ